MGEDRLPPEHNMSDNRETTYLPPVPMPAPLDGFCPAAVMKGIVGDDAPWSPESFAAVRISGPTTTQLASGDESLYSTAASATWQGEATLIIDPEIAGRLAADLLTTILFLGDKAMAEAMVTFWQTWVEGVREVQTANRMRAEKSN
jgi:hypothetical protein